MIRAPLILGLLLATLWNFAEAQTLRYQGQELSLSDRSGACYLVFIKLYEAAYFRSEEGDSRCVGLDYLRSFSGEELARATREVFQKLHGESLGARYQPKLARLAVAYRGVEPGDSYQFCVGGSSGAELRRDGETVVRFADAEFGERLMKIWVADEQAGRPNWNFQRCPGRTL